MNKLQNFVFAAAEACPDNRLFFHIEKGGADVDYNSDALRLDADSVISFGTYFNCLSVGKWMRYCAVRTILLCIEAHGSATVSVHCFSQEGERTLLEEKIDHRHRQEIFLSVGLTDALQDSLLYVKITSGQEPFLLEKASFQTDEQPRQKTSLGLVVTTYKRENFVRKNLHILENDFLASAEGNSSHVYVVDNGKTLEPSTHPQVTIVPNKNFGGAGGFARGMLEVCQSASHLNYVVLCDDDILFIAENFKRLIYFLDLVQDRSLCVRGSMLRTDRPWVQHENGAVLNKGFHFIPQNYNLDLSRLAHVLANEREGKSDYAGWWMFAFPARCIAQYGYPFPAFIRWDDAEYSLRLADNGLSTISLNGVAVWHEPFEYKFSPSMYYYEERNCFLARSIHDRHFNYFSFLQRGLLKIVGNAVMYRYESAQYCLRAYADALKGPDFFMEIDPEKLHAEIVQTKGEKVVDLSGGNGRKVPQALTKGQRGLLLRLLCLFSLNGHLLPQALASRMSRARGDIRHLPLLSNDYVQCFGARKIYYMAGDTLKGYAVRRSSGQFFSILLQYVKLSFLSYGKFCAVRRAYNKKYRQMTSEKFWVKYLGLAERNTQSKVT